MRRFTNIFLLLFLIISGEIAFAQKIDYSNIDYNYLEDLIKTGIDSLRNEKKLPALYKDSILFLASKNHSDYLFKTDKTGHYQKENPEMETPHKRIAFYGGNYLTTGENVAKSFLFIPLQSDKKSQKTITVSDYKTAATEFVL